MEAQTPNGTASGVAIVSRHPERMIIIAHRGASAQAPESTAAAIRQALACRAQMIELDVQMTRDKRLVVFHDDRIDRTTDARGALATWRYPDLARLDAGAWFDARFAGQRILLVSQALGLIPRACRINLEIKRTRQRRFIIDQLIHRLVAARAMRRVLLSSFDPEALRHSKRQAPHLARALLCRNRPADHIPLALELNCIALHPHVSTITPSLLETIHRAGLRVHVWTVDRLDVARRLAGWGVDGVFTNAPHRLWTLGRPSMPSRTGR